MISNRFPLLTLSILLYSINYDSRTENSSLFANLIGCNRILNILQSIVLNNLCTLKNTIIKSKSICCLLCSSSELVIITLVCFFESFLKSSQFAVSISTKSCFCLLIFSFSFCYISIRSSGCNTCSLCSSSMTFTLCDSIFIFICIDEVSISLNLCDNLGCIPIRRSSSDYRIQACNISITICKSFCRSRNVNCNTSSNS